MGLLKGWRGEGVTGTGHDFVSAAALFKLIFLQKALEETTAVLLSAGYMGQKVGSVCPPQAQCNWSQEVAALVLHL